MAAAAPCVVQRRRNLSLRRRVDLAAQKWKFWESEWGVEIFGLKIFKTTVIVIRVGIDPYSVTIGSPRK